MRLYILFMGPADQDMEWTDAGVEGISRFVRRLWRVVHEVAASAPVGDAGAGALARKAHETIERVTDDLDRRMQFHTPISAVMELVNELADAPAAPGARFAAETARLAAPAVGAARHRGAVGACSAARPPLGAAVAAGRPGAARSTTRSSSSSRSTARCATASRCRPASPRTSWSSAHGAPRRSQAHLDGKEIRQTIVVPGKLVNLVVG